MAGNIILLHCLFFAVCCLPAQAFRNFSEPEIICPYGEYKVWGRCIKPPPTKVLDIFWGFVLSKTNLQPFDPDLSLTFKLLVEKPYLIIRYAGTSILLSVKRGKE